MMHLAMTRLADAGVEERAATRICEDPFIVRGASEILKLRPLLSEFCTRCGQDGWEDLKYFFDLPYARNKRSAMILLANRPGLKLGELTKENLAAVLLIHEYLIAGWRTGVYLTDDYSARRSIISPEDLRCEAVQVFTRVLLRRGAALALLTYREPQCHRSPDELPVKRGVRYKTDRREVHLYLPLLGSLDETLAALGKRTRSHMRYYRRMAERDLECQYVANVSISEVEFSQFNRQCSYATTDDLAKIRYRALSNSPQVFLSGLRAKDGSWLSMVGGYRTSDEVEIYWQLNSAGFADYSISTVMRSFLMEDEIGNGRRRLLIEGGTSHPMRHYFINDRATDLFVVGSPLYAGVLKLAAKSGLMKRNFLVQFLVDEKRPWRKW